MHISSDNFGTHVFTYRHDDSEWNLEIKARDAREAMERLKALPFARYDGELIAKIPLGLGPLMRAAIWLRNVWHTMVTDSGATRKDYGGFRDCQ